MGMSRKDYVAIAAAIKEVATDCTPEQRLVVADIVRNLCRAMQADNNLFRRTQFIEACGLKLEEMP
jgi:hypothetical protein